MAGLALKGEKAAASREEYEFSHYEGGKLVLYHPRREKKNGNTPPIPRKKEKKRSVCREAPGASTASSWRTAKR